MKLFSHNLLILSAGNVTQLTKS